MNRYMRLAGRALAAGALAFVVQLQASDGTSASVIRSCVVAGALAALEVFTPLNSLVGIFAKNKDATIIRR
jgi:hypothetical protein